MGGMRGLMTAIPDRCPGCGRDLYPLARLRPTPSFSAYAWLLVGAGSVVTVLVYWGGIILVRSLVWIPMWLLAFLWFPLALIPALGFGLLAHRFPKMLRMRCRRCGWKGRFVCARLPKR